MWHPCILFLVLITSYLLACAPPIQCLCVDFVCVTNSCYDYNYLANSLCHTMLWINAACAVVQCLSVMSVTFVCGAESQNG